MQSIPRGKRPSVSIGQRFQTKQHGVCTVVAYNGWDDISVQFEDGFIKTTSISQLNIGSVRNPYYPSVEGIGFVGEGSYPASDINGSTKVYAVWSAMLRRCYSEKQQKRQPSYIGCTVDKEWHNFQNFAGWYYQNSVEGWELDKDLLTKGNRLYSRSTCCFIPPEINSFLTKREKSRGDSPIGVHRRGNYITAIWWDEYGNVRTKNFKTEQDAFTCYKNSKERRAKLLAEKWKELLTPEVYKALINFSVSIED